ncbi:hypothetical protein LCGC14_1499230 [marine sediment metagenome]|uniref:Uncharacterized protein n=1 Tax=marine sediment metagenome TaxID=412755 RepID=A0A0F9LK75_9ZZZZ
MRKTRVKALTLLFETMYDKYIKPIKVYMPNKFAITKPAKPLGSGSVVCPKSEFNIDKAKWRRFKKTYRELT